MRNLFEVAIYNRDVREALDDGGHHKQLSDDWADMHFIEVMAKDREDARAIMLRRYSPNRGYVITEIRQLD